MRFKFSTREELIAYALEDFLLRYNIVKKEDKSFDNIITNEILHDAWYCIKNQLDTNGDYLVNSNLNKLIYFTLLTLNLCDESHVKIRKKMLRILKSNDIGVDYNITKIVKTRAKDERLIELCKLYIDLFGTGQSNSGEYLDNNIASDKFLFEKVIKKVAVECYGKNNIKQKIKGIEDIGQAMYADTIVKAGCKYILMDAKFYTGDLIYNRVNSNKVTYKYQNNRFQMNAYIDELKYQKGLDNSDIVGVIVHAVDTERLNKFTCLDEHSMNIANNKIILEFIRIDVTAEEIKKQIRSLIEKYA